MKLKDKLRDFLDIPKTTKDGFKYYITSDENQQDEVRIVGFSNKFTATEIPKQIENIPVRAISGLRGVPFKGQVVIPDTVHTIGDLALDTTKEVTKIVVPSSVRFIGHHAFHASEGLEEIIFSDEVDISTGEGLLCLCPKLRYVRLSEWMITEIPSYFLSECESLERMHIPDSVISVEECAFYGCRNLNKVHFSEELQEIGEMAFMDCRALETVHLHKNIEVIGESAFEGCQKLCVVRIPPTIKKISAGAFANCPNLVRPAIPEGCEVDPKAFSN